MSLVTRCPRCKTLYRVVPAQLQARGGQVRCGRCMHVFDGFDALAVEQPNAVSEPVRFEPEAVETAAADTRRRPRRRAGRRRVVEAPAVSVRVEAPRPQPEIVGPPRPSLRDTHAHARGRARRGDEAAIRAQAVAGGEARCSLCAMLAAVARGPGRLCFSQPARGALSGIQIGDARRVRRRGMQRVRSRTGPISCRRSARTSPRSTPRGPA